MQIQPETVRSAAFGLLLEVDPNIEIPGIADVEAPPLAAQTQVFAHAPTRVRLDPRELARRWSSADRTPGSARELRDGETVLLSVELAPPAGYLLHASGFGRILVAARRDRADLRPGAGAS